MLLGYGKNSTSKWAFNVRKFDVLGLNYPQKMDRWVVERSGNMLKCSFLETVHISDQTDARLQLLLRVDLARALKRRCIQSSRTFDSTLWPLRRKETLSDLWDGAPPRTHVPPTHYEPMSPLLHSERRSTLMLSWAAVCLATGCLRWDMMLSLIFRGSSPAGTESPSERLSAPRVIKGAFSNNFSVISGVKCPYPGFISSLYYCC